LDKEVKLISKLWVCPVCRFLLDASYSEAVEAFFHISNRMGFILCPRCGKGGMNEERINTLSEALALKLERTGGRSDQNKT
jgi:hypothetical protein